MKMKELAEKPREKALMKGMESLTDTELLALLIESGTREHSAFELAMMILAKCQGIGQLSQLSLTDLMKFPGIKKAKALRILGMVELARRLDLEERVPKDSIEGAKDVYYVLESSMKYENQEHFMAIYLDTKNQVLRKKTLFIGSLNCSIVHPREVFKEALHMSAASIIVAHNHPSGDPTPSKQDMEVTEMLKMTGKIMQIPLIDHVIIGKKQYFSFREAEML